MFALCTPPPFMPMSDGWSRRGCPIRPSPASSVSRARLCATCGPASRSRRARGAGARCAPCASGRGAYAELLGFYLGDGHIVRAGRTSRLRISLDERYPGLVDHVRALVAACFPSNEVSVGSVTGDRAAVVSLYSSHLPCVFPQHGAGKKRDRPIVLEPWQRALVEAAPWSLLRGLLLSDGCFFINRTGRYRYLSAEFTNLSNDSQELFCRTCDRVGVRYRVNGRSVRIYRRESVQLLACFVGTKR